MGGLFQPMHLLLILIVALVIMGPGKIANLGKELGQAIKGFQEGVSTNHNQVANPPAAPQPTAQSQDSGPKAA